MRIIVIIFSFYFCFILKASLTRWDYLEINSNHMSIEELKHLGNKGWELTACPVTKKSERSFNESTGNVFNKLGKGYGYGYAWSFSEKCIFKKKKTKK